MPLNELDCEQDGNGQPAPLPDGLAGRVLGMLQDDDESETQSARKSTGLTLIFSGGDEADHSTAGLLQ